MLKKIHLILIIALGLGLLAYQVIQRNITLSEKGTSAIARVYKIKHNAITAKTSTRTIVFLEFYYSNERNTFRKKVLNDSIKLNDCYEILFNPENIKMVEVSFRNKIDCLKMSDLSEE